MPTAKPAPFTGLIPDAHIPHHNPKALKWAIKELQGLPLTELVILGDLFDVSAVSRFMKSLRESSGLPRELQQARETCQQIDEEWFPGIKKTFLLGNHEWRIPQYLRRNAPEMADLPDLMTRRVLGVPDDWEVVAYGDYVKRQGVLCQHGKKFSNNTCRSNILLGCSSVQGHSHRLSMISHRFAGTRKSIICAELGCLCDFNPGYAKLTDWSHAFGFIDAGDIHVVTRGARA